MMTESMMEMMEKGSFDSFVGNMSMIGAMIKGEGPEGMEEEGQGDFFASNDQDANMMDMMGKEMEHMGEAFGEMSEDQMGKFMEGMGEDSSMMNIGDMAGMGMDMGDMDMEAMSETSESMGEAFGGSGDESGMISEEGMSGGGNGDCGGKSCCYPNC